MSKDTEEIKPFSAEALVGFLKYFGVEPTETFTADSGDERGYVLAWDFKEGMVVEHSRNGLKSKYEFAPGRCRDTDLGKWLVEGETLGPWEKILQTAAIYGASEVFDAEETGQGASGPFRILVSRTFRGSKTLHHWLQMDGEPEDFPTLEEASKRREMLEGMSYNKEKNEVSLPEYLVASL